ncbi:MAG: SurA N-terminal domain-containing protein, partial [Candidatus Omnitrophota bacterium]|nr:SurA N-terminal domain-containing protein [Candidatus Omnitrophota bacterium]
MKKLLLLLLIVKFFQPINAEAQIVNKVIAVINNEVITQQDVDRLLSVLYAQYVHEYKGDELLEKMEEVRKDILKRMIEDKLILSRAKELDIKVAEKEIKEKLELVKGGFARE